MGEGRDLNGLIGLQMRRNLLLRRNRLIKQTIDYLVALPLCVVSVPIIAALALWIMIESEGSPFYAQIRAGKDGRSRCGSSGPCILTRSGGWSSI